MGTHFFRFRANQIRPTTHFADPLGSCVGDWKERETEDQRERERERREPERNPEQ